MRESQTIYLSFLLASLLVLNSNEMSAHNITLNSEKNDINYDATTIALTHNGFQIHDVSGGTRRKIYRQPQKLLLLFMGIMGMVFIIFCINGNHGLETAFESKTYMAFEASERNETLAQTLEREVRVLCWVMTTPKNHKEKALHVLHTWGKRCNKLYFVTSQADDDLLNTIVLEKMDKYEVLWGKTKAALKYIYENLREEADWFMKADDDTYVFVENLRYMLYPYLANWPIYFGFNFKLFTTIEKNAAYMSGGAGYILSREALRRFVVEGLTDPTKCRPEDNNAEDVELGSCLRNVGVHAGDSRDSKLKNRFLPFAPYTVLISDYNSIDFWYYKYAFYNPRACIDCLSEYPVGFHYVDPLEMYVYEYFCYEFETFNLEEDDEKEFLPSKLTSFIIPPSDNLMIT